MVSIFDIREMTEDKVFTLISSLDVDFMEIAFIDNEEGFIKENHIHEWHDISFVMKGSITYEIEGNVYEVSEGDVVIVPPRKYHKEICDPKGDFEVLFVCVSFKKNSKVFDISKYFRFPSVIKISNLKEMYDIFEDILKEVTYRQEGYLLKINAQIYNLLVAIFRNENCINNKIDSIKRISNFRKKKTADEIKQYIEMNYNKKISLDKLSKIFFLSPQYISALFSKQTGYTPIEYLNKIRIEKAKKLFVAGETNISKVAQEVGFGDIHYFYKVFRQFERKTPVQFISNNIGC